jgi:hypothetical protein
MPQETSSLRTRIDMPTPLICLAAKGVSRDAESGTISVFSIFEQITPVGLPAFIPEAAVFALWRRDAGDPPNNPMRFEIRNNETLILGTDWTVGFGDAPLNRSIIGLAGVVIREPGDLHFQFVHADAVVARYTIQVNAPAPQVVEAGAPAAQGQQAG